MKVGQTLANFPDIAPREFVETLEQLHFNAPPMHWSLLKEMVFNEFGDDPENLFAAFEKRAFAAASLGQVHGARLKTGEDVAIKIQYPGIARTIRQDIRNLILFMLPARLSRDWENTKEQFDDLGIRLERETDYQREAAARKEIRACITRGRWDRRAAGISPILNGPRFDNGAAARCASRGVPGDESVAGSPQRIRSKDFEVVVSHAVCRPHTQRRSASRQLFVYGRWPAWRDRLWVYAGTRRHAVGPVPQDRPAANDGAARTAWR